jgi:serine protease Do
MVKSVMESLTKQGKVVRGWLGVSIQQVTPELARQFNLRDETGALIGDVIEGGPADKAGLQRGDIILEYDSRQIEEPYILRNMVANTIPGEKHTVKILREGKEVSIAVTIGELPADAQQDSESSEVQNVLTGVGIQELSPDLAKKLRVPDRVKGVIVSDVDDESAAAGILARGDVIQEINRKRVTDPKTYQEAVSKIGNDDSVLLLVFRAGSSLFITLSPK